VPGHLALPLHLLLLSPMLLPRPLLQLIRVFVLLLLLVIIAALLFDLLVPLLPYPILTHRAEQALLTLPPVFGMGTVLLRQPLPLPALQMAPLVEPNRLAISDMSLHHSVAVPPSPVALPLPRAHGLPTHAKLQLHVPPVLILAPLGKH